MCILRVANRFLKLERDKDGQLSGIRNTSPT